MNEKIVVFLHLKNRDKFRLDLIILVRARKGRTAKKKAPVRELFYFTTTISVEPVKKYINLKPFLFNSASTLRICGVSLSNWNIVISAPCLLVALLAKVFPLQDVEIQMMKEINYSDIS